MPTPLPPNPYEVGTPMHTAYSTCLAFQAQAQAAQHPGPWAANLTLTPLVCARLLGYMIIHSPTPQGRLNIRNEINSCDGSRDMFHSLAKVYVEHYLRSFRSFKGRTPAQSDHPSQNSFDEMQETTKYALEATPKNHAEAKAAALERDGYRCMVTGTYDMSSCEENPDIAALAVQCGAVARETRAACILGPSMSQDISGSEQTADGVKCGFAASAWGVMERIGDVLVPDHEMNSPSIHRLENIMTLETSIHILFNNLKLWFEPTNGTLQHQYHLHSPNPALYTSNLLLPQTVVMFASTSQHLPLPDPRYLAFHALCARVAHLSGAGEYLDTVGRDLEVTGVLDSCGGSVGLLEAAFNQHVQFVSVL